MAQKTVLIPGVNWFLNLLISGLFKQAPKSPLDARARYRASRLLCGILLLVALFICICFVSWLITSFWDSFFLWFAEPLVFAFFIYVYYFYEVRGISFECPNCHQIISASETPWVCGECDFINKSPRRFPVVDKCGRCSHEPKAYKCHHQDCQKFIFFSEDRDPVNPAKRYTPSFDEVQRKTDEQAAEAQRKHEDALRELDRATELARRKQRLKRAKDPQQSEEYDEIVSKVLSLYKSGSERQDVFDKLRAEAREKFKDNPKKLQKRLDLIDEIELNMQG